MMPGKVLSTQLIFGDFLNPDNLPCSPTLSYQLGGVGISDPTQGLEVQVWMANLINAGKADSYITLSAPNTPTYTLLTLAGVTSISLAFDQNMKPCLGLISQGIAYLWWYDATIPGYAFVQLPLGTSSVQVTLDDKRAISIDESFTDIVLLYLNNTNLFMRQQRDRFLIDYLLMTTDYYNPQLYKVGMCRTDRLLIQVNADLYG